MRINYTTGLLALGIALISSVPTQAQTTPAGTATTNTYPQGAARPDSMSTSGMTRAQKRAAKKNRRTKQTDAAGTTNTSVQNARYRESSASDGTAINNSNVTNYNSNNVTNAPTGAGSNPNTKQAIKTETNPGQTKDQLTGQEAKSNAGAIDAVKGAETSKTPAVKSGSTVRNTSIGDFMASSPNFTTLQNALQSAGLSETLKGTGPYTIFAPTNEAFKKLPTAVQGALLDGSNKEALKQLLSYHVVSGTLSADDMTRQIKTGNGKTQLATVAGGMLTAQSGPDGRITLTDEQGNKTYIDEKSGDRQQNGMVYEIDSVLMPKSGAAAFR